MLISGFFLFSTESVKMYGNGAFTEMISLVLIFSRSPSTARWRCPRNRVSPPWRKLTASFAGTLSGVGLGLQQ